MLVVVLAAAVGYGTVGESASPLGPWLEGGYPQEMSLEIHGKLHLHTRLDAYAQDVVVLADDLPWTSNRTAGLLLQVVEAAVPNPAAVAPSQAFLRHSHFTSHGGTEAFKTFGYTATTNELDDTYYYPLAATADGRHVLVVRASDAVPSACRTKACLYDHMNKLEDLTDYVATRTLSTNGTGPVTKHTFYYVSGTQHLSSSSTSAALSLLLGAVSLGLVAAAIDIRVHHQKLKPKDGHRVDMDNELIAFAAVGVFAAVSTTLLSVYWDEAAGKEHSTIRVVDGDNGVHRHLPAWSFVYVGLSAAAVVASLAALIFAHSKHDKLPAKPNPRYNKWTRFLVIFTTTVAVALACALPASYESALGSRSMAVTNQTLVDGALNASADILHAHYETQADARDALDSDSYMTTVKMVSWGSVSLMLLAAASAAGFNQAREQHAPHESSLALLVAVAALVAAGAAITQASMAEHFDLSDHAVCTLPPEWGWYMAALLGAAVFYIAAAGLVIAVYLGRFAAGHAVLSTVPYLLLVAAGLGHALAAYSHLDSHCPRLTDHHWVGTFSAISLALLITTMILFGFATPGHKAAASDVEMIELVEKPPGYTEPTKPTKPTKPAELTEGFFGL
jgi:hypothetical protein